MLTNFSVSKAVRAPDKIKKYLSQVENIVITNTTLYIMFPEKFVDKHLSILGNESLVLGIFAIVDEKYNYSVSLIPSRLIVHPSETNTILIDTTPYVILKIEAGTEIIAETKLICNTDTAYDIYNLFFTDGKIPWYLEYMDIPMLFTNLTKYAASKIGKESLGFEILTAIIAKDENGNDYRTMLKNKEDLSTKKIFYIGLENIWHSYNSTLSKVAGSYMKTGIVSAILSPEKEISDLEHTLRE